MDRSPRASDHETEKHSGRHHTTTQTLATDGKKTRYGNGAEVSKPRLWIVRSCSTTDSHGFAPSATMSIRMEDRLVSLWSLWAIMAQWRSRHFTKATRATSVQGKRQCDYMFYSYLLNIRSRQ